MMQYNKNEQQSTKFSNKHQLTLSVFKKTLTKNGILKPAQM